MGDFHTVIVEEKNVNECKEFARKIIGAKGTRNGTEVNGAQSSYDFGNEEISRDDPDRIADTILGKIAEYAFAGFLLKNYDIKFLPNNDIKLEQHDTDNGNDLHFFYTRPKKNPLLRQHRRNDVLLDIKGTKKTSQWLNIEVHKDRIFSSQFYISVKCEVPNGIEVDPELIPDRVNCEICGFAFRHDLLDPETNKPWFCFEQGEHWPRIGDLEKYIQGKRKVHKKITPELVNQWTAAGIESGKIDTYHIGDKGQKARLTYGLPIKFLRNAKEDWDTLITSLRGLSFPLRRSVMEIRFK